MVKHTEIVSCGLDAFLHHLTSSYFRSRSREDAPHFELHSISSDVQCCVNDSMRFHEVPYGSMCQVMLHGPCHGCYEVPAREEALQEAAGLLNQRRPGGLENSA